MPTSPQVSSRREEFGSNCGATVFTGARIIPDVVIGKNAVVGAGAVVLKSVAQGSTVVGVPAREISRAR